MKGCLIVLIVSIVIVLAIVLALINPLAAIAVLIVAGILCFFILMYKIGLSVLNLYWTLFETLVNLLERALSFFPKFDSEDFATIKSILVAMLMCIFHTIILYFLLDIHLKVFTRFVITFLISVIISALFWVAKTAKRSISEELYEQKITNLMLSGKSYIEAEEILNEHYEIK